MCIVSTSWALCARHLLTQSVETSHWTRPELIPRRHAKSATRARLGTGSPQCTEGQIGTRLARGHVELVHGIGEFSSRTFGAGRLIGQAIEGARRTTSGSHRPRRTEIGRFADFFGRRIDAKTTLWTGSLNRGANRTKAAIGARSRDGYTCRAKRSQWAGRGCRHADHATDRARWTRNSV